MIGTLDKVKNQDGSISIKEMQSSYKPSQAVKILTLQIKQDYEVGYEINHREFAEFNNMSLIDRSNVDQKAFNSYVPPKSLDPDESWRWNGVSDITRAKTLSTAAHLVSGMMYPGTFAQNDEDEEDQMASYVMGELIEWNIKHSSYELTFLYGVIAALVNPVAYIHVDYAEVMQTIKERTADGITSKEVIDKMLSGLQIHNVPADEILITNAYEFHIQKQRAIMRRRTPDYDELKAKYGTHENWRYVTPGIKALYNEDDAMFYDQNDDDLTTLGEEVIYYNRREDIEVPFVNGIYFGETDVTANPIKHRDNKNRPKYPYVKFGAEPIDEKSFYFYKSLVARLSNNQEEYDLLRRMMFDGTLMEVMSSMAIVGGETANTDIMFPGTVTNIPKDSKVLAPMAGRNLQAGWQAIGEMKEEMSRSSQEDQLGGKYTGQQKTAFEAAKIEANARINLGIMGRLILQMVSDIGELIVDKIVIHQTIREVSEIVSDGPKYRNFLLADKTDRGKNVTEKISFDAELMNMKLDKKGKLRESFKVLSKQGGKKGKTKLIRVNPRLFSRLNFLIMVEPESWMPRNKRFEEMISLEKYDRLIASPYTDHEAVTQDFLLKPLAKNKSEKYMLKDKQKIAEQVMGMQPKKPTAKVGAKAERVEALT